MKSDIHKQKAETALEPITAAWEQKRGPAIAYIAAVLLRRFPTLEIKHVPGAGIVFGICETHGGTPYHFHAVVPARLRYVPKEELANEILAALERRARNTNPANL